MPSSPRSGSFHGSLLADGFLFEQAMIPEASARQRILALWRGGARVLRVPCGLVLLLPASLRVRAEEAPGAPLVLGKGSYFAMPIDGVDLPATSAPSLVRISAGVVEVVPLPAVEEEPALWLGLAEDAVLVTLEPLGEPPVAQILAAPPVAPERDARAVLGAAVPGPDPRREAVLNSLLAASGVKARSGTARSLDLGLGRAFLGVLGWALRGASKLVRALSLPAPGRPTAAQQPPPARSSWWSRLLVRVATFARLTRVLGHRQAAYLARTIRMFEQGDLDQALRHAIPIGAMEKALHPALGLPSPRTNLQLSFSQGSSAAAIMLGAAPLEHLRQLYRSAFERLDRADRVEEAAFVLAELLHADAEAVAYLERRGRLVLAAELAEGRKLPAGLVVRQWFLAGDRRRALRIARERNAFFDAVTRLEPSHPEEAKALRLCWADGLADAGDYATAADVASPVAEARELTLAWIDRAIAVGESQAPRMLARKAAVVGGERWDEVAEQIRPMLDVADEARAPARMQFLRALAQELPSAAGRALGRAVLRAALLAGAGPALGGEPDLRRRLLDQAIERDLRTDLPALSPGAAVVLARQEVLEVTLGERGVAAAYDVAELPSGRVLLALGEAGVRVLGARGNTVHHFAEPAAKLVVSVHGDRALALAPRGEVWRVAMLDLHERKSRHLADLHLDSFASSYDGATWWVAEDGDVMAIELLEPRLPCRFRVGAVGYVYALAWSPGGVSFLATRVRLAELEQYDYELPSFTLRRRPHVELAAWELHPEDTARSPLPLLGAAIHPGTWTVVAQYDPTLSSVVVGCTSSGGRQELILEPRLTASGEAELEWPRDMRLGTDGRWLAVATSDEGGCDVRAYFLANLQPRARIRLPGAKQACMRLGDGRLQLADDRGQTAIIDLEKHIVHRRRVA